MATADGSGTPLTVNDLNVPFGVPQLDAQGNIPQKVVGDAGDALINGVPLVYLLPSFSEGASSGEYIPIAALGQPGGVPKLNTDGFITAPIAPEALIQSLQALMAVLSTTPPSTSNQPWNNNGIITLTQ